MIPSPYPIIITSNSNNLYCTFSYKHSFSNSSFSPFLPYPLTLAPHLLSPNYPSHLIYSTYHKPHNSTLHIPSFPTQSLPFLPLHCFIISNLYPLILHYTIFTAILLISPLYPPLIVLHNPLTSPPYPPHSILPTSYYTILSPPLLILPLHPPNTSLHNIYSLHLYAPTPASPTVEEHPWIPNPHSSPTVEECPWVHNPHSILPTPHQQ